MRVLELLSFVTHDSTLRLGTRVTADADDRALGELPVDRLRLRAHGVAIPAAVTGGYTRGRRMMRVACVWGDAAARGASSALCGNVWRGKERHSPDEAKRRNGVRNLGRLGVRERIDGERLGEGGVLRLDRRLRHVEAGRLHPEDSSARR